MASLFIVRRQLGSIDFALPFSSSLSALVQLLWNGMSKLSRYMQPVCTTISNSGTGSQFGSARWWPNVNPKRMYDPQMTLNPPEATDHGSWKCHADADAFHKSDAVIHMVEIGVQFETYANFQVPVQFHTDAAGHLVTNGLQSRKQSKPNLT